MDCDRFVNFSEYSAEILDKTVYSVVKLLKEQNLKIASAESLTGGLISSHITDVSGSSEVFDLGLCTYAAEMKTKMLGVKLETIEKYNVVSEEVAKEMADGLHKVSQADLCITTTGVAGPTGGTEEIPVGTVCFGFYFNNKIITNRVNLSEYGYKSRKDIRNGAVLYAFCVSLQILSGEEI